MFWSKRVLGVVIFFSGKSIKIWYGIYKRKEEEEEQTQQTQWAERGRPLAEEEPSTEAHMKVTFFFVKK